MLNSLRAPSLHFSKDILPILSSPATDSGRNEASILALLPPDSGPPLLPASAIEQERALLSSPNRGEASGSRQPLGDARQGSTPAVSHPTSCRRDANSLHALSHQFANVTLLRGTTIEARHMPTPDSSSINITSTYTDTSSEVDITGCRSSVAASDLLHTTGRSSTGRNPCGHPAAAGYTAAWNAEHGVERRGWQQLSEEAPGAATVSRALGPRFEGDDVHGSRMHAGQIPPLLTSWLSEVPCIVTEPVPATYPCSHVPAALLQKPMHHGRSRRAAQHLHPTCPPPYPQCMRMHLVSGPTSPASHLEIHSPASTSRQQEQQEQQEPMHPAGITGGQFAHSVASMASSSLPAGSPLVHRCKAGRAHRGCRDC